MVVGLLTMASMVCTLDVAGDVCLSILTEQRNGKSLVAETVLASVVRGFPIWEAERYDCFSPTFF